MYIAYLFRRFSVTVSLYFLLLMIVNVPVTVAMILIGNRTAIDMSLYIMTSIVSINIVGCIIFGIFAFMYNGFLTEASDIEEVYIYYDEKILLINNIVNKYKKYNISNDIKMNDMLTLNNIYNDVDIECDDLFIKSLLKNKLQYSIHYINSI